MEHEQRNTATTAQRVERADRGIAQAVGFSQHAATQTQGQRNGGLVWELDWRAEKAEALGEALLPLRAAVGEARRIMRPIHPKDLTPEALASERRALHVELQPLLERYVAAEGHDKMAVIKEMGGRLDRHQALSSEAATRHDAAARVARSAKAADPQIGFGY
jgi:hypothetical protein